MLLGRRQKLCTKQLMDGLAAGKKPRQIAFEAGCSYSTLRRRLSRHIHALGFQTPEQAVAHHVAEKIKALLPLALRVLVDRLMAR